jgi:hypothetical protein
MYSAMFVLLACPPRPSTGERRLFDWNPASVL